MDFTTITVEILKSISQVVGGYGWAIIFLTIIVRVVMWPLSVSQQKSMKKMQELSPKLKEIQTRYKSDPQVMQKKMMEFYKEHSFNPFGGCFPLLLQMPIFILLYTALISPQFIEVAGKSSFFFINRLDAPIRSHAGETGDQRFGVARGDTFSSGKTVTVYTKEGAIENVKIEDPGKAFNIKDQKQEVVPGKPLDLQVNLDKFNLPYSKLNDVQKVVIPVINNNTKEIERITFDRTDSVLTAQVKTEDTKTTFNYDVLVLILLFGVTMFWSQKVMMAQSSSAAMDPAQQQMQETMGKMMPIMITSMFIFFPIPAGVLLYMIVSNIIQVVQTVMINKSIEKEKTNKAKAIVDKVPSEAKPVEGKLVEDADKTQSGSKKKKEKGKW
ncbi:MAG: hypothetical protein ACD_20C00330G0008 [uncultured bacterium]|nr:MAG: hypothetical protein ACD_20C00330G0008 [uncultured bacterium]